MARNDIEYRGWQIGLTYQSKNPGGQDRANFHHLLSEMAEHHMNLLSIMMQSYACFDPLHDGYAWPTVNPKLECYRDTTAVNAQHDTEFLHVVFDEAKELGIEIELFLNWGIWNPAKVITSYPNMQCQVDARGRPAGWLQCPDSPGSWQLGIDEVDDLFAVYRHPNVKRFAFERFGYAGTHHCYCSYSREAFRAGTGKELEDMKSNQILEWKADHVGKKMKEYVEHVKQIAPGIKIGLHTQGNLAWGHDPARFAEWGIDFVEPHTIQYKTSQTALTRLWKNLAPNPCILHVDVRDTAPVNYPILRKKPRIIKKTLNWIKDFDGDNIKGILFFNEPAVSEINKRCVYEMLDGI